VSQAAGRRLLIRGARVFDGVRVRERADVLVEGERIAAVEAAVDGVADAEVVDAGGRTLLPGLIDAHAHVRPPHAELALAFGVTTVLDMGSEPAVMGPYRREAARRSDLADLRSSSAPATPTGGHPNALVGLVFDAALPGLDDASGAGAFVAERLAEGADYVKLVIEDGAVFGASLPVLAPDVARAVVRAAHERGLLAVAHVHTLAAAWQAVQAGADGLAHLFVDLPPDDRIAEAIAGAGMFVTPTLTLLQAMAGIPTGAGLAADERVTRRLDERWVRNLGRFYRFGAPVAYEHAVEAVRRLDALGVPLLAGTDAATVGVAGTVHGASVWREVELLAEAGLAADKALAAATSAPAAAFGLDDRGRIAPGRLADLILVDGDPTADVRDLRALEAVWRRGVRLRAP
jgi:imidazolonepropionase-like amidohydrolase